MGLCICLFFWIALALIVFKLYVKLTTGWCRSNVCLLGKTTIITGANSGIGYETAADFAKRGARVILACRDESRGQEAVAKIIKATNNNNVVYKHLDLSSLQSVRDFAKDINGTEEKLDILVNNAGAGHCPHKMSKDGLQLLMQINYFGPFLLTNLLLDSLKKAPKSRVVNVSSVVAKNYETFDINNINFNPPEVSYRSGTDLYARTKLCNILFTIELADRLKSTGVTVYSLHPGIVLTNIFRTVPPFIRPIIELICDLFFKNSTEGAQTSIYCSIAKGIEDLSGEHFADCQVVGRYKTAQNPDLPGKLWKISEKLVKLNSL